MTVTQWFSLFGLALSLAGTVIAGRTLFAEWRQHRGSEPLVPIAQTLRRLLHRHRSVTVSVPAAHLRILGGRAEVLVGPAEDASPEEKIRDLYERVARLDSQMLDERQRVNNALNRHDAAFADVEKRYDRLGEQLREVATGSIRLELVGLLLVALGSVIAAVPSLFWPTH